MLDEERLNPHGVGHLPHALTKKKSSTLVVRGLRVECAYYWCLSKFPPYFRLNFNLKMKQEIEVESMLMTQEVLAVLPSAYAKS